MILFYGDINRLINFPIQPKMKEFSGENNQLISFPSQPKMEKFYGRNNQLMYFANQPKMIICKADPGICNIMNGKIGNFVRKSLTSEIY